MLSREPVTAIPPRSETQRTVDAWPYSVCTQRPVGKCQTRSVRSHEPDTIVVPSTAQHHTPLLWPERVRRHTGLVSDHTRSVLSSDPLTTMSGGATTRHVICGGWKEGKRDIRVVGEEEERRHAETGRSARGVRNKEGGQGNTYGRGGIRVVYEEYGERGKLFAGCTPEKWPPYTPPVSFPFIVLKAVPKPFCRQLFCRLERGFLVLVCSVRTTPRCASRVAECVGSSRSHAWSTRPFS